MQITLETPALLFSATSLILLAYTNRFLTIAGIIRSLKSAYEEDSKQSLLLQIKSLNLRLTLIRYMQLAGVLSLFFSVFSMLLLFMEYSAWGLYLFGISLFLLLISLFLSFWEINISVDALRHHLSDIKEINNKIKLNPFSKSHNPNH